MSSAPQAAVVQPDSFAFTDAFMAEAKAHIAKYPEGRQRSALLPLLHLVQRQEGWISKVAMDYLADMLGLAPMRVYEVATFYTMYTLAPRGKHSVRVCTNVPCWLRGSDRILEACREALGVESFGTTEDGLFTLEEVECSGACVNAPVVEIDDDYYEDLTADSIKAVLESLKRGETPKAGSQSGRQCSAPAGGPTSLTGDPAALAQEAKKQAAERAKERAKREAEKAKAEAAKGDADKGDKK